MPTSPPRAERDRKKYRKAMEGRKLTKVRKSPKSMSKVPALGPAADTAYKSMKKRKSMKRKGTKKGRRPKKGLY